MTTETFELASGKQVAVITEKGTVLEVSKRTETSTYEYYAGTTMVVLPSVRPGDGLTFVPRYATGTKNTVYTEFWLKLETGGEAQYSIPAFDLDLRAGHELVIVRAHAADADTEKPPVLAALNSSTKKYCVCNEKYVSKLAHRVIPAEPVAQFWWGFGWLTLAWLLLQACLSSSGFGSAIMAGLSLVSVLGFFVCRKKVKRLSADIPPKSQQKIIKRDNETAEQQLWELAYERLGVK